MRFITVFAAIVATGAASNTASAADKPKPAAPAAAAAATSPGPAPKAEDPSKDQSAWVKVCDQVTFKTNDKEEKKKICLTHHERIDANTGSVLVSAAIREIEGQPAPSLMVMVPLGMAIPVGIQAKVDEDKDIIKLPYTVCHQGGCAAEGPATPELIAKLKSGKQLMIAAVNVSGTPLGFPVPLVGFGPALEGGPMDSGKYADARKKLMDVVKQRQAELAKASDGTVKK
jgi:invasion protein IalB